MNKIMHFEKINKILALLCAVSIVAFVGYYIKDGFKTYDIKVTNSDKDNQKMITVKVNGEVVNPGTYKVPGKSRVCEAIYAAGGITESASVEDVDLNAIVTDSLTIQIPSEGEKTTIGLPVININTADKETFLLVPGIGTTIAERIIKYRKENGRFKKIEDITRVKGIGETSFNKMKDYIKTEE